MFLFTAQGKSAFAQFKEVDSAFEKQHSILTGKEQVISNSKIQILITAKRHFRKCLGVNLLEVF